MEKEKMEEQTKQHLKEFMEELDNENVYTLLDISRLLKKHFGELIE